MAQKRKFSAGDCKFPRAQCVAPTIDEPLSASDEIRALAGGLKLENHARGNFRAYLVGVEIRRARRIQRDTIGKPAMMCVQVHAPAHFVTIGGLVPVGGLGPERRSAD